MARRSELPGNTMPTKEQDFKERLVAIMRDVKDNLTDDTEAMWTIGSLAARLVDLYKVRTWTEFKAKLSAEAYDRLLKDFKEQGNAFHRDGKDKAAYAVQLLAISVIARTQTDPQVKQGEQLLDGIINGVVATYRKAQAAKAL
jgi:hypothetical protein